MNAKPQKKRADGNRASSAPLLTFVGSDKGGIGKSFITTVITDLMEVTGTVAHIVQVDDQDRLPALYPGRVTTVVPASLDDLRRDPAFIVAAFDPFYAAVEVMMQERVPLVVDVGGPQQTVASAHVV